jgi:hypothetical protein
MNNKLECIWKEQEGNKPLGRPKSRWENNIKMNLREIGWADGVI